MSPGTSGRPGSSRRSTSPARSTRSTATRWPFRRRKTGPRRSWPGSSASCATACALGLGMPPAEGRRRPSPQEIARAHGIRPDYDLPEQGAETLERHADDLIQTLIPRPQFERRLSGLHSRARAFVQEQGVNALHAAFGFVEWLEAPQSAVPRFAPLLLLPVELTRTLEGGVYVYRITAGDADAALPNLCLNELLRQQFGLALPEFDGEADTPEAYFARVAAWLAREQPRWRLRRFVVVGLFNFQRQAMYLDLDPAAWAADLADHDPLRSLLGTAFGGDGGFAEALDPDADEHQHIAATLIADADATQFSVVADALGGRSFPVEGPPGTGKSQTITNLIGASLARGRTVLFLAEKLAALEVVKKRMEEAGLGEFCLELHSAKVGKAALLDALAATPGRGAGRHGGRPRGRGAPARGGPRGPEPLRGRHRPALRAVGRDGPRGALVRAGWRRSGSPTSARRSAGTSWPPRSGSTACAGRRSSARSRSSPSTAPASPGSAAATPGGVSGPCSRARSTARTWPGPRRTGVTGSTRSARGPGTCSPKARRARRRSTRSSGWRRRVAGPVRRRRARRLGTAAGRRGAVAPRGVPPQARRVPATCPRRRKSRPTRPRWRTTPRPWRRSWGRRNAWASRGAT